MNNGTENGQGPFPADGGSDLTTLLSGVVGQLQQTDNPLLQLLAMFLLAQQQPVKEEYPDELEPHHEALRREVVGAQAEIRELRNRIALIAAALGRCDDCWGEDAGCMICGGRGSSGYFWPDRHSYQELVAPAVARLRKTGRDEAGRIEGASGSQHPGGQGQAASRAVGVGSAADTPSRGRKEDEHERTYQVSNYEAPAGVEALGGKEKGGAG